MVASARGERPWWRAQEGAPESSAPAASPTLAADGQVSWSGNSPQGLGSGDVTPWWQSYGSGGAESNRSHSEADWSASGSKGSSSRTWHGGSEASWHGVGGAGWADYSSKAARRQGRSDGGGWHKCEGQNEPSTEEIIASVKSLCDDGLKPFGRMLSRRLCEREADRLCEAQGIPLGGIDPERLPRLVAKRLRRLCEHSRRLITTSEDGREFLVLLANTPRKHFLDVYSTKDLYPDEFWLAFTLYLDNLEGKSLPGARHACARQLAAAQLPFLQGYSLAQVWHIVDLAVNQRRLLRLCGGVLLPCRNEETVAVEVQTSKGWGEHWEPESSTKASSHPSQEHYRDASLEEVRAGLSQLLSLPCYQTPGAITLSNVKRAFREHFQLEFEPQALGFARVCDLLNDSSMSDVCDLIAQRNQQLGLKCASPKEKQACWMAVVADLQAWGFVAADMGAFEASLCSSSPWAGSSTEFYGAKSTGSSGSTVDCSSEAGETVMLPGSPGSSSSVAESETPMSKLMVEWPISIKNTFIDLSAQDVQPSSHLRTRSMPCTRALSV